jgi:hypothetical protein
MPYPNMQQMIDGVAPFGLRSYWKSRFLRELPNAAIETFVEFAESRTSLIRWRFWSILMERLLVWRRLVVVIDRRPALSV